MRPARPVLAAALLLATLTAAPSAAADDARPATGILALLPDDATSRHTLETPEGRLDYTATAGTITLRDGTGSPTAAIFHVAYRAEPADPARPVTFVFNGGPGAAATYLHLGALGPRTIAVTPDGRFLPPPQRLVDNPDSWLAFADLVFVDPPGTGYSRAADPEKAGDFYGVDRDASAMAAFVRLWLQKENRLSAPVYLAGESYGGFRAARLARTLQEEAGIAPSGVVLISPALEFARLFPDSFDVLAPALLLPSLAAAKLEADGVRGDAALAERLKPVEDFALGPYLTALALGRAPSSALADRIAEITGLDPAVVRREAGRVDAGDYAREIRRGVGETVSLYDATIPRRISHPTPPASKRPIRCSTAACPPSPPPSSPMPATSSAFAPISPTACSTATSPGAGTTASAARAMRACSAISRPPARCRRR